MDYKLLVLFNILNQTYLCHNPLLILAQAILVWKEEMVAAYTQDPSLILISVVVLIHPTEMTVSLSDLENMF